MQDISIPVFSTRTLLRAWQDSIFGVPVTAEVIEHSPAPDCGDESGVYYSNSRTGQLIGRLYRFSDQWWIDSRFSPPSDPDIGYEDFDAAETALILGYLVGG